MKKLKVDPGPGDDTDQEVASEFPCSLSQERFWFLEQLDPGNPALTVAVRWRLDGKVDAATLEQAIRRVLSRHGILRTSFVERDGRPQQRVHASVVFNLRVIDLTQMTEAESLNELARTGIAEGRTPFDIVSAPLLRATLVRLAPSRSVALVSMHHLVCDGWSVGIVARDIGRTYQALREQRQPALPELPIQYGDYALWQRAWIASGSLDTERDYWRQKLSGLERFEVPVDRPRPALQTSHGEIESLLLARHLTDGAAAFGRSRNLTFFMTALAALVVTLLRYSGKSDIVVGTQVAGRDQIELEEMVGLFINTLVLRVDASGDPTMAELLVRIQDAVGDALTYRNMPFEQLIETVRPGRDLSRGALYSINFIFQRSFIRNESYGEYSLVDLPSISTGALYDLNFFMVERPEGWRASCEFNTDLFDLTIVKAMLSCWQMALAAITTCETLPLSRYPLLDDTARRALAAWNDTSAPYPSDTPFPGLFEAQAARSPASIAVVHGDQALTYRELDRASNRFARYLQARGIGRGCVVGLCVDRSADMVVALLGVLKAGAAYVPLDPAYAGSRLAHMINDAGLTLLVTEAAQHPRLPLEKITRPAAVITLEDINAAGAGESGASLGPLAEVHDPAYIIFTSGSAGRPKGVQVPHNALVNLLWSMRARPGLTEVDTVVAVTTICFDIAALEIFLPLMVGARLVVATSEEARDGAALATLLQRSKASLMQATPITWQMLVEAGWDSDITMLCGGEALTRKLADRLLARGGALWNMYGPTETTIWSAAGQVHEGDGPITIGPPIANTQLHVLNDVQQQTPLGGVGELYIGGDGVALGYLNRADLTRRGFLPDPFRSEPNARMYRSGDLVRRRADGSLEFLGRVDHQVKLRGFRIELGEVEAVLLQHPDVAAAVASLGKDGAGEDALCAYVVPAQSRRDADTDLIRELRRHLAELLPLHMLPSSISLLTALPRTANGKIDRRALPQPERNQPAVMAPAATHLRNTISRLSLIWQAVLGLQDISPDADFFELGGHSLLAVRMLRRVEAEFGERHRIATLFRAPTIRAFASVLGAYSEPPAEIEVAALQPHGTRPPIIAINNSGVFFSLAKALGQQQPFIAVFLAEPERRRELADRSLEDLATEYVGFMKQAQPKGPYILFGWCQAGVIAYEIAQQLLAAGEEVQLLAMADAWAPGYLRRLRWLRSLLADLSYRWQWHVAELRTGRLGLLEIALNSRYARKLGLVSVARGLLRKPDFLAEDAYAWYVDYLAARIARYQPKPYGGSVLLFHNPRQPSGRFLDRALGWTDLLRGRWKVVEVQGDHLSIFQAPGVDAIARWIEAALNGLEPWCGPERRPRSPDTTASTDNGNTAERLGSIKEELA